MNLMKAAAITTIVCGIAWSSIEVRAQDATAREMRDRAEIEALMWRYVRALDTMDADAYAAAYTADGQFKAGTSVTKGRDALRKMVAGMADDRKAAAAKGETRPPMYHVTTNSHVSFMDANHARIDAYYMTVFGASGQSSQPRIAAAGRIVDLLVRIDGKWLIQSRDVSPRD